MSFIVVVHFLMVMTFTVRILLRDDLSPPARLAWFIVLNVLPYFGVAIYFLMGEVDLGDRANRLHRDIFAAIRAGAGKFMGEPEDIPRLIDARYQTAFAYAQSINGFSPVDGNRAALMADSEETRLRLIEDIDAVFTARENGDRATGVSFSGLLNAIDGVAAQEGRALFMTTNHVEQLDPALTRAGRADVHVELGLVGPAAARTLFLRFFPSEDVQADRFAASLGEGRFAPAALQGWLLSNATDASAAASAAGLRPALTVAAE